MLEIDTKREIITGEFARKTWSKVLAMWLKEKTVQTGETEPKYEVKSQSYVYSIIVFNNFLIKMPNFANHLIINT